MSRVLAGARTCPRSPRSSSPQRLFPAAVGTDGPVLLTGLLPLGTAADAAPNAQLRSRQTSRDATVPPSRHPRAASPSMSM